MKSSLHMLTKLSFQLIICVLLISVFHKHTAAATVIFDFTSIEAPSGTSNILLSQGGINLDITGNSYRDSRANGLGLIYEGWIVSSDGFPGLGVLTGQNSGLSFWINRATGIGNSNEAEFMMFTFNQEILLLDIHYTIEGEVPDNPTQVDFKLQYAYDLDGDNDLDVTTTAPTDPISRFGITSLYEEYGLSVNSLIVSDTAPSAIPLPTSLPLYGVGLFILGIFGWRRKNHIRQIVGTVGD